MKTILTIDLDIIMGPSIKAYDVVGTGHGVAMYEEVAPILKYCNADLSLYTDLTAYLKQIYKIIGGKNFKFVTNHHELLDYVDKNETYDVINYDFHGDILSGDSSRDEQEVLNCGNWVYYFAKDYHLNSYLHVGYENSVSDNMCEDIAVFKNCETKNRYYKDFDISKLPQPDLVVLCLSPEWVTTQFWPLFDLWKVLFSED